MFVNEDSQQNQDFKIENAKHSISQIASKMMKQENLNKHSSSKEAFKLFTVKF